MWRRRRAPARAYAGEHDANDERSAVDDGAGDDHDHDDQQHEHDERERTERGDECDDDARRHGAGWASSASERQHRERAHARDDHAM